jgi:DNA end-binding protein Ku
VPRSIWNGTIALGTIAVPVKVYSATESKTVRFHEVHEPDGGKIEHHRICPEEEREVPYGEVVKGFEVAPGEYVVLDDDEIAAAAGERSRVLDVEAFVEAAAIDPVSYDRTYTLGARDAPGAYRLLHDALVKTGRAGLARWVFHNRERLVAIRPRDGVLAMHTMRFHDELVAPGEVDVDTPSRGPSDKEVEMAGALVDTLHAPFRPEDFADEHREHVLAYLDRKRRGEAEAPEPAPEPEASDDLLAALQASVKAAGKGR